MSFFYQSLKGAQKGWESINLGGSLVAASDDDDDDADAGADAGAGAGADDDEDIMRW